MSKLLSKKDSSNKSISIYSDPCQNEAELEKIFQNNPKESTIHKKQIKAEIEINQNKLNSKEYLNSKASLSLDFNSNEEKTRKSKKNEFINNTEIKNLENFQEANHVDLSSIKSRTNSNHINFVDENDLNKMFEVKINPKGKENFQQNNSIKKKAIDAKRHTSLCTHNTISNNNYDISYNVEMKNNSSSNKNEDKKEEEKRINKVKFEGIQKDEIDLDYFNSKLINVQIDSKNIKNPKNKYIKTLYELQDILVDESSAVSALRIDDKGQYLAIGCKSGIINIYNIINYNYDKFKLYYNKNNLKEYLYFIEEKPFKSLNEHSDEIVDIFWLPSSSKFLLSSSLYLVILWNIFPKNNDSIIKKYRHNGAISSLCINQVLKYMFATGCGDKYVRIFGINKMLLKNNGCENIPHKKNEVKLFNIKDEIHCINFLQEGNKIAVGTNKGRVLIYLIYPKINFLYRFDCKNTFGKPITNMNFFSLSSCIISSLDSRIRFVNIQNGKIIHKYKGHINEKNRIISNIDLCNDVIIAGSEDGNCYFYNIYNKENDKVKNYSYEFFMPFPGDNLLNLVHIISEKCYVDYFQKILK